MKFTDNYFLGSVEAGQPLDPLEDSRRFVTIDRQLLGLFQIFGNGVIAGWDISSASGLAVSISPGRANVNFMSAETVDPRSVVGLTPNATNYIYAQAIETTRYDRNVRFFSDVVQFGEGKQILLAIATASSGAVISVDQSVRKDIGFIEEIKTLINTHRHRGGKDNPTKIDLETEVMGILPGFKIDNIDASKISKGRLSTARIPKLEHSDLEGRGVLTHAQLDSYVRNLSNDNAKLLGEVSTINILQLYLANKHMWNEVDAYASNTIFFIPGIASDSMIDLRHTTAIIDKENHTLQGVPSISGELLTTTFSSLADFNSVQLRSNIDIGEDGGGAFFKISRPVTDLIVESFDNVFSEHAHFDGWTIVTRAGDQSTDLTSDSTEQADGTYSAKFKIDQTVRVEATKLFTETVDWSKYSEIEISIETRSTEHGAIKMQVLSSPNKNGSAVSISDVELLKANETTVGFRRIVMDITDLDLKTVKGIRIYTDTALGWNLSAFVVNIDRIKINNTLFYNPSARMRFRLKTPQRTQWAAISWVDDNVPGKVQVRARTAPTFETFDRSSSIPFSTYLAHSGDDPKVTDNRVIEIEVALLPPVDKMSSPIVRSLTVSYITSADSSGITIDTANQFIRATRQDNSRVEDSGNVVINGRVDVGDIVYGLLTSVQQTSLTNSSVQQYGTPIVGITGSLLPLSPIQAATPLGSRSSSLGGATEVIRLKDRTYLVADTSNDRIILFNNIGKPVRILCSNNVVSETELYPLTAGYNPLNKTLYIAWSMKLSTNGLDLSQATINGVGLSIPLSNIKDSLIKTTGKSSDIQTANACAIVLSDGHARQIIDFLDISSNTKLYLEITDNFAQEKVKISNVNFATLTSIRGLPIFIGDIKFVKGIFRPISATITALGNYLIGNAKPLVSLTPNIVAAPIPVTSAIEMDPDTGAILYSDNSVDFSTTYLGNAIERDGKYFVLAGTIMTNGIISGRVNTTDKKTGRAISQYKTSDGTIPSDVQLDADGNLVIVERDAKTTKARVIKIDEEGNTIFQYMIDDGSKVNDVRVLSTGNLIIST